ALPLGWGAGVWVVFLGLAWPRVHLLQLAAIAVMLVILGAESLQLGASWSPYYKVHAEDDPTGFVTTVISVNGIPHQSHMKAAGNPIKDRIFDLVRPRSLDDVLTIDAAGGKDG